MKTADEKIVTTWLGKSDTNFTRNHAFVKTFVICSPLTRGRSLLESIPTLSNLAFTFHPLPTSRSIQGILNTLALNTFTVKGKAIPITGRGGP
jgi:hypothetical protein